MKALAFAPVLALAALTLAAPGPVEAAHRHGRGCGHSYYDRGYSGYRGSSGYGDRYYDDYSGGRYYGRGDYGRDYERRYYDNRRSYGYTRGYGGRGYGYGYSGYPVYGYGYGYYPPPPPRRYCPPRPRVGIYFGF